MTAFIAICSKEYIKHYDVLFGSLEKFQDDNRKYDQILYHIGDVSGSYDKKVDITDWFQKAAYPDTLTKICSLRARVVLDAFEKGYKKVIFLGAKVEFFAAPDEMIVALDYHDAVVTPHITKPLPNDGRIPSNASVSFTGHISTDVVGFYNSPEIVEFLTWQDETMKTQCATTSLTYLDQSWLNFIPFFVSNVHILRSSNWNVAYWNLTQRGLSLEDGVWHTEDGPMVCFQYSGLEKGREEYIARYQNREQAVGELLMFLKNYTSKL